MPNNKDQTKPRSFSGIPLYTRRATCKNMHKTPYMIPEIKQGIQNLNSSYTLWNNYLTHTQTS